MKKHHLKLLVSGICVAAAVALAVGVHAQTSPPPGLSPAAKSPPAAPVTGHHKDSAAGVKHEADLKTECQAMMTKKQEMLDKHQAMDVRLDKLVAEMNAAKGSKEVDAMQKPMAAVINELVAQHKASRSMMMEMQPAMMAHMMRHMEMQGAKGAMECPMIETCTAPEAKPEEKKAKM
jgi:hypothetical protein